MARRRLAVAITAVATFAATALSALDGAAATTPAATYGVGTQSNVSIAMSDGVHLTADVYYPTDLKTGARARGHFPVIVAVTPYSKNSNLSTGNPGQPWGGDGYYPYLVQHGYINLLVDARGTGSSQGAWALEDQRERQDGVEIADWAAHRLAGSDGVVGLAGASYLGINQFYTAALAGPNSPIKAIFPVVSSNDDYRDTIAAGGIYNSEFMPVWAGVRIGLDVPIDGSFADPVSTAQVAIDHTATTTVFSDVMTQMLTGGPLSYDSSFWQQRDPANYLAAVVRNHIPAFLVGGWFDLFQRGVLLNYAGLQNAYDGRRTDAPMSAKQPVTGRYQAVVGPWYHDVAALDPGVQAYVSPLMLAWFDHWLKGVRNGIDETTTPLHLFELGANKWVNATTYPLVPSASRLYLAGAGASGAASINDGALTAGPPPPGSDIAPWVGAAAPCNRATDQWSFGFGEEQVDAVDRSADNPCTQDDRTTEAGALTYTSKPLRAAQLLAGPMNLSAVISSSATDAELVVTVEDVAPDGSAYPLSSGDLIASQAQLDGSRTWREAGGDVVIPFHPFTQSSQHLLTPGKPVRVDVELPPTVALVAAGHRIRITVTTGDTPHLQASVPQTERLMGSTMTVSLGGRNPSYVTLPLAPPAAFATSKVTWGPSGS